MSTTLVPGGRLDAIPNTLEMFTVGRTLDQMRAREQRLARVLSPLADSYDHILIDCPPSLDILTDNALTAADGVLIPVQAEDSSLKALRLLLAQVAAVDADLREHPLVLHGLVVSLLRRPETTLARSVLEQLAALPDLPVLATVPLSVTVTEAWRYGRTVVAYQPNSEHAEAYRKLARVLDGALTGAAGARVTAVVNQKGGVGKSATTVNVGGALAEAGRRVLVVDLDPQGHMTDALKLPAAEAPATLAAALTGEYEGKPADLVVNHSTPGIAA